MPGKAKARADKAVKPDRRDRPAKSSGERRGWLVLGVGADETPLAGGKAVFLAQELCGPDAEVPDVDTVRAAFPAELAVGATESGTPVTLRALVGATSDEGDDEDEAETVEPPVEPPAEASPPEAVQLPSG